MKKAKSMAEERRERALKQRAYRQHPANKPDIQAYNRAYYEDHREEKRAYDRERYLKKNLDGAQGSAQTK